MKENFYIKVESYHLPGRGAMENVHELTPEQLKVREVINVDIAHAEVSPADYKPEEDPLKVKSEKTGRGPLVSKTWRQEVDPVMTCYKLVTIEFKWFGLQTKAESIILSTQNRLFLNFNRQVFCWMDKWTTYAGASKRRLKRHTGFHFNALPLQPSTRRKFES